MLSFNSQFSAARVAVVCTRLLNPFDVLRIELSTLFELVNSMGSLLFEVARAEVRSWLRAEAGWLARTPRNVT